MAGFFLLTVLSSGPALRSQTLRGTEKINSVDLRLPALTVTGVSIGTSADGALVKTTTGLERQQIELQTVPNNKIVLSTYAGTAVRSVTLFDPQTFSTSTPGTTVNINGPASESPNNCGALSRSNLTNPASYASPTVVGTLPAQNPLGGGYWLGGGADTGVVSDAARSSTTPTGGTGLGITAYLCPIIP